MNTHVDEDDRSFPQRASGAVTAPNPTTEYTQRQAGPNFFRDGENVQFMRASSSISHALDGDILRMKVKTTHQVNRTAQTHDSVMHQFIVEENSFGEMHFQISFFTTDIFRVKFAGDPSTLAALTDDPVFPPPESRMLIGKPHDVKVQFSEKDDQVSLASPTVEVRVTLNPFRICAYRSGSKHPFWRQRLSDLFTADAVPCSIVSHKGREATFEAFVLDPQEGIYGLGERFDGVARRGRPVDFVNHDAIGTSSLRSYINVPYFWSTHGYGCFVNSIARTEFDMGMSEQGTIGFSTEEKFMDYFVVEGKTPQDLLNKYTHDLTGTAPLPPIWTFGLWLSRNSYQSWDVVDSVLKQAEELEIPHDVVNLDTAWFKEDWNPDLKFSEERFPDPEKKLAALMEKGIHISVWQYTFVPPRDDNELYVEALAGDYIGREVLPDGSRGPKPFTYPEGSSGWRIDDLVIDYSNPEAVEWYSNKITHLIEMGVSSIKTDFGDCIPPDAHYKRILGRRFQNLYSLVYNAAIHKATHKANPEAGQWARSGTAGSQRYPVHWGGDSQCSWSALQGSLNATLSIGLSGFPYFSHDIGGFIGKPSPELYVRWAQLVLWSSHSRSHGAGDENGREPWLFGDEAVAIFKKYTQLRYKLLPYIISEARAGSALGLPLVRHLILSYPEDRNVWTIETQYTFGSNLLIAPVLCPAEETGGIHNVYLPEGIWYDFWTKVKTVSRGQWIVIDDVPLDVVPIFVKEGTALPLAQLRMRTWNKVGTVEKVECYGEGSSFTCEDGEGGILKAVKSNDGKWSVEGREGITVDVFA